MAFKIRLFTQKDLDRIEAYHRGEIQKPQWIIDWEKKIEDARLILAAAVHQELLDPHQQTLYVQTVAQMMHRRDRLYDIWMEELPFKTWEELANERPPSSDDLFQYTVKDTEDYLNGPGVSAFVCFLDQRWKGFLKDFAHQCLRDCDPLIEESFLMTPEIRHTLSYPEQTFGTSNKEILEARLIEWTNKKIHTDTPSYVVRLLVANVWIALDKEMSALTQMEFARCEAAEPNFERMMKEKDPATDLYLTQAQRWQIEVLLKMWPSS